MSSTEIRPIETQYAGCRFRSRLEARWAVFFDALGIEWQYEPEGYTVGPDIDRKMYLPDFWLPLEKLWVEVKGDQASTDLQKLAYAADPHFGLPGGRGHRILLLGNIPRVDRGWFAWHHGLTSWKGDLFQDLFQFGAGYIEWLQDCCLLLGCDGDYSDLRTGPSYWKFDAFVGDGTDSVFRAPRLVVDAYRTARSARFEHGERP